MECGFDKYMQLFGHDKAGDDIKYKVLVTDGQLNIDITSIIGNAATNAIKVEKIG